MVSVQLRTELRRMILLAERYEHSAQTLAEKLDPNHGAAATLLDVLALEVALKAASWLDNGKPILGHDYWNIWRGLAQATQDDAIARAQHRNAGHTDFSDIEKVLRDLTKAFGQGRYSYEALAGLTDDEARRKGQEWVQAGAVLDDAEFAYRPMERNGLFHGLCDIVKEGLAAGS